MTTKINKVGSRHTIYLKTDLVNDSNFPFQVGESLIAKIEGDRLIIQKEKEHYRYKLTEKGMVKEPIRKSQPN